MKIPYVVAENVRWLLDKTQVATRYIESRAKSNAYMEKAKDIRTFCLFVGYPRSGHSLVGSLLDAHPNTIIANELDVLRFVSAGFSRDQIFYLLLRNSELYSRKGRTQTGYKYDVPNQWQGRTNQLLVLGDKKGGMTTQRLSQNPLLLEEIRTLLKVPIKFIHVVRNPFDNITTMAIRTNSTILKETIHYFELCLKNTLMLEIAGPQNVLTIRHEDLIVTPETTLAKMVSFLDIETEEEYFKDCAGIIYRAPHKSREKHPWDAKEKNLVLKHCAKFPFLADYTFDN